MKAKSVCIKSEGVVGIILREARLGSRRIGCTRFVMEAVLSNLSLYKRDFTTPFKIESYSILPSKGYGLLYVI